MKRVLVRPSFHDWCQNRLFANGTSFEGVYSAAFARWRTLASESDIRIDTWDCAPLKEADVLWFLDLPPCRREFKMIWSQLKPGAKTVLQILESPALSFHAFRSENRRGFDAVLTYEHHDTRGEDSHCFHYRLPSAHREMPHNRPFAERKGLLVLNSNRVEGFWAMRQLGLAGLPLVGRWLSGWKFTVADLREFVGGELYSVRRALLRSAERIAPDFVDLFGSGWNGEQVSWCPWYPSRSYACWRGKPGCSKDELCAQYRFVLAFENFRGRRGYISEKIFDAFFAGSVPVYLGDERISDFVPVGAFVDARNFAGWRELLLYLQFCSESEWQQMRQTGQAFTQSDGITPFTEASFVEVAARVLHTVLGN